MSSEERDAAGVPPPREPRRYLTWLCEGCDHCEGEGDGMPCTNGPSPSMSGATVVRAEDYDALRETLDASPVSSPGGETVTLWQAHERGVWQHATHGTPPADAFEVGVFRRVDGPGGETAPRCPKCRAAIHLEAPEPSSMDYCAEPLDLFWECSDCDWSGPAARADLEALTAPAGETATLARLRAAQERIVAEFGVTAATDAVCRELQPIIDDLAALDAGVPVEGVSTPEAAGVALIAAERARQVAEEGLTPAHDAQHADGELAWAAVHYLGGARMDGFGRAAIAWPWIADGTLPRPHGRLRNLIRAGALIAAEIDRLQRAPAPSPEAATFAVGDRVRVSDSKWAEYRGLAGQVGTVYVMPTGFGPFPDRYQVRDHDDPNQATCAAMVPPLLLEPAPVVSGEEATSYA